MSWYIGMSLRVSTVHTPMRNKLVQSFLMVDWRGQDLPVHPVAFLTWACWELFTWSPLNRKLGSGMAYFKLSGDHLYPFPNSYTAISFLKASESSLDFIVSHWYCSFEQDQTPRKYPVTTFESSAPAVMHLNLTSRHFIGKQEIWACPNPFPSKNLLSHYIVKIKVEDQMPICFV